MEPEKIQSILQNFRNSNVSEEDIKFYFDQKGVKPSQWQGFVIQEPVEAQPQAATEETTPEVKKKNSPSQSTSETEPMVSGLGYSYSGLSEETSIDNSLASDLNKAASSSTMPRAGVAEELTTMRGTTQSRMAQQSRTIESGAALADAVNFETQLKTSYTEGYSAGDTPLVQWGPTEFSTGERSQAEIDRQIDESRLNNAALLGQSAAKGEAPIAGRNDLSGVLAEQNGSRYEAANEASRIAFDLNLFDKDEAGNYTPNIENLLYANNQYEGIEREALAAKNAELKKMDEDFGEVDEVLYDLNTGVKGIGNSFLSMYYNVTGNSEAVEAVQYQNYLNSFRTQASYINDGLNQTQIDRGISGNIAEGDFGAAFTIFTTQLAQTAPQLAMQAATTLATGGFGMSASASLWAGSGVMGVNVMGTSLADSYGTMSDGKRWLDAFGQAAIETMTERLFAGDQVKLLESFKKGGLDKMSRQEIKDLVFKKGLFSEEMRRLGTHYAKEGGKSFLKQGFEEGVEEFIATLGGGLVHSMISGEELPSMAEAIDAAIVGFGAGGGISTISGAKRPKLAIAALSSVGVTVKDYVQLKAARQSAAANAAAAKTDAERSVAQGKVDQLSKIHSQALAEEQAALEEYSDADLDAFTAANHAVRDAAAVLANTASTQTQRNEATKRGKQAINKLAEIREKNTGARAKVEAERKAISDFDYGITGSVEITNETQTQGSKLLQSLVNVRKALGGTKVFAHADYDAMSEATGIEKTELFGAQGIYKSADGTIHIMLPAAQQNTGFHEAFHAIARGVDKKYVSKFVRAALPSLMSLPNALAQKYADIAEQYKENKELQAEEIFAEINADIAAGVITQENVGTSLAHAAASALRQGLSKALPFINIKKYPTFTEFANYTKSVAEGVASGVRVSEASEGISSNDPTNTSFFLQMSSGAMGAKAAPSKVAKKADVIKALMPQIKEIFEGNLWGYSLNTETLEAPTGGYMVSDGKSEFQFPLSDGMPSDKALKDAIAKQIESAPNAENAHFGAWVSDGVMYLDISENVSDKTDALTRSYDRAEIAIYDVSKGAEIKTPKKRPTPVQSVDINNIAEPELLAIPTKPLNNSLVSKTGIPAKTLQQVIKDFREENGRDPKMAFWMGDQSGYGEFIHSDGIVTRLEGGMGHALNKGNLDDGIVWANNKTQNELDGIVKDADIIAIVSGHPVKSQRFYKGTSRILGRELMLGMQRTAGNVFNIGSKSTPVEIKMPKVEGTDPMPYVKALLTLIREAKPSGKLDKVDAILAPFETWEDMINEASKKTTDGAGHRADVIANFIGDFEAPVFLKDLFREMGMKSEAELSLSSRDGYLVENDFQEGDVYLYFSLERNADGTARTQPGNHTTYFNNMYGTPIAVAAARQNLFDFAPNILHTAEKKLSGHAKLKVAQDNKLTNKAGEVVVPEGVDVASLSDKEVSKYLEEVLSAVGYQFRSNPAEYAELYEMIYNERSRALTTAAADMEKMRVLGSSATHLSGQAVLYGLATGKTMEEKVNEMNWALKRFRQRGLDGYDAIDMKTFLDMFYGGKIPTELSETRPATAPAYGHVKNAEGFFKQTNLFKAIADMLAGGMTKTEVVAKMTEDGFTRSDAEAVYAKALGYKQGINAGIKAGIKSNNSQHKARLAARREKESDKAASIRAKAKAAFAETKAVNAKFIEQLVEFTKEFTGMKLSINQVTAIVRTMNSAQMKVYKKAGSDADLQQAVYTAVVNKIIDITERNADRDAIAAENAAIKRVKTAQKSLLNKLQKLPKSSKNPLVSYKYEIERLANISPEFLSAESVLMLEEAVNDLNSTTKFISAKSNKDGSVTLNKPFVNTVHGEIDTRRAKVYFNEQATALENEAREVEMSMVYEMAIMKYQTSNPTALVQAGILTIQDLFEFMMRERLAPEIKGAQKKLKELADDLGLDLTNIQDLEIALEALTDEKAEGLDAKRDAMIKEGILPTAMNFLAILENNAQFSKIFGLNMPITQGLREAVSDMIVSRMSRMSTNQVRRVEFALYDFIVNGSTFGLDAIAAEVAAKNDGVNTMNTLGMTANVTANKKGGNLRNWAYGWLETTPTFFRRLFLQYNESNVVEYMHALGFSSLRSNAQAADAQHAQDIEAITSFIKGQGMNTAKNETLLHIYSMLQQQPAQMTAAEWTLYVRKQFEDAIAQDKRFNKDIAAEKSAAIKEAFYKNGIPQDGQDIIKKLEKVEGLKDTWAFVGAHFQSRMPALKNYAENFLGQQFVEERNYLPIKYRKGSDNETLQKLMDADAGLRSSMDSYNASKLGARATATFERNPQAIKADGRYIDLAFFSTIEQTNHENEVKTRTASDIAYISEMTSEKNAAFTNSIPEQDLRRQVRQKVFDYMVDQRGALGDEMLSPGMKKVINYGRNLTILNYFGAVIDQIVKQSAPMWNTLIEARSFDAKMEFFASTYEYATKGIRKELLEDEDHKYKLISAFDIQNRNLQEAVLSFTGDRPSTLEPSRFEKGMDLSTASLRVTDKVVATASWFAYYKEYMYREGGVRPQDFTWADAAANPNLKAGDWAAQMVAKDQNISTSRDRSKFGRYTRGNAMGMLKLFGIPFIDFLMNKKMNMILDVQKLTSTKTLGEASRSLAGTTMEIAHFQTMMHFVLSPIYAALGAAIFGEDDEETSWFSAKFNFDMWLKGMMSDLNPVIMPIGFVEDGWTTMINLGMYAASEDSEVLNKTQGGFFKGFEVWDKTKGIPNFVARKGSDDQSFLFRVAGSSGVVGSVAANFYTSSKNIVTLQSDVPYYLTTTGTTKYLNRNDADKMILMEASKLAALTTGAFTGLQAKELMSSVKDAERGVTKRATTNENEAIELIVAEAIKNQTEQPVDALLQGMFKKIDEDPQGARSWIAARKEGLRKEVKQLYSKDNEYIATLRDIDKRYNTTNELMYALKAIGDDYEDESAKSDFYRAASIYFAIEGRTEFVKAIKAQYINYGEAF